MGALYNIKTLVAMQLKDKMDLSFLKSKRSTILTTVMSVVKLVAVSALFFALFYVCVILKVFSFAQMLPDTVVNVLFTIIEVIAIVSCTLGLTKTLYLSLDNKVLLTLPVTNSEIFASKLVLFYLFELKRNFNFTLPMFIAYGIVNGAVWYYYPWLVLGFVVISLLPVLLGAVLSIPALFAFNFILKRKWLQYALMVGAAGVVTWIVTALISLIPENINILGQWGTISVGIQEFLASFRDAVLPFYYLCLLVIGGTMRISQGLFGLDTLVIFVVTLAVVVALVVIAYFSARPLFFKMASKQFEYEKVTIPPQRNKAHSPKLSPYVESALMQMRSSRQLVTTIVGLVLPFLAILLQNKLYSAMNTSYNGQVMTKAFSILVLLVMATAFNSPFATVYSREANARNLLKTRPVNPLRTLFARISLRAFVAVLSVVLAVVVYGSQLKIEANEFLTYEQVLANAISDLVCMGVIGVCVTVGHLLWCAEMDVMHNQAEQYQTIGEDFNNPNEAKATVVGLLVSAFFAFWYFFISDVGSTQALVTCAVISLLFLVARTYLYVARVKHYFVEN